MKYDQSFVSMISKWQRLLQQIASLLPFVLIVFFLNI